MVLAAAVGAPSRFIFGSQTRAHTKTVLHSPNAFSARGRGEFKTLKDCLEKENQLFLTSL
jgi:hypothetical protein